MTIYYLLLLFYATIPTLLLLASLKWTYKDLLSSGKLISYLFKFLITISFLPLLLFTDLDLGIDPVNLVSKVILLATIALAALGIRLAQRRKCLPFYLEGVIASFMEEILFRGILFSLVLVIFQNQWVVVAVTSVLFGVWHLKNFYWSGKRWAIRQFFTTILFYAPLFSLLRIWTGDIYLAILAHFINDSFYILASENVRSKIILWKHNYIVPNTNQASLPEELKGRKYYGKKQKRE